jgi:predicted alpha/beta-hydrolase family hydrolase
VIEPFSEGPVRGFLHRPVESCAGIVLGHGAGSNSQAPLLVAVATEFAAAGWMALRCDLPFRQARPSGPPRPGDAALDREGLRAAADAMRRLVSGRVCLGGHSYGGRQATMLAAFDAEAADALLLLSYPLHPPRKPSELRTAHFPRLRTPAMFAHGARDPFGTVAEVREAIGLIPGPTELLEIERAGHDLKSAGAPERIVKHFIAFMLSRYNSGIQSV